MYLNTITIIPLYHYTISQTGTVIQIKEKAAIKGIDKYVKLFFIWLSIDRLLPNCKLSMKTSTKKIFQLMIY